MTEQEIKAEHDRLRPIVFEGAPDNVTQASMSNIGYWHWSGHEQLTNKSKTGFFGNTMPFFAAAKNQPETDLDWTQSLLIRSD